MVLNRQKYVLFFYVQSLVYDYILLKYLIRRIRHILLEKKKCCGETAINTTRTIVQATKQKLGSPQLISVVS